MANGTEPKVDTKALEAEAEAAAAAAAAAKRDEEVLATRQVLALPPKPTAKVVTYECTRQFYSNQEGRTYYPGELYVTTDAEKPGSHHKPTDADSLAAYKKHFPLGTMKSGPFSDFVIQEIVEKKVVRVVEAAPDGKRSADQPVV